MDVVLQTLSGARYEITISITSTLRDLKETVEGRYGIPADCQSFTLRGHDMNDGDALIEHTSLTLIAIQLTVVHRITFYVPMYELNFELTIGDDERVDKLKERVLNELESRVPCTERQMLANIELVFCGEVMSDFSRVGEYGVGIDEWLIKVEVEDSLSTVESE